MRSLRTRVARFRSTDTRSDSGTSSTTAERWNVLPATEACSTSVRSPGGRRSIRAASTAWIVGGTDTVPAPCSADIASICSRKSGFPSAASRMRACSSAEMGAVPGKLSTTARAAGSESGSRWTRSAAGARACHSDRTSRSSSRATQSRKTGALIGARPTDSTSSRNVGSAQWRSSKTTTRGRSRASASRNRRTAQ